MKSLARIFCLFLLVAGAFTSSAQIGTNGKNIFTHDYYDRFGINTGPYPDAALHVQGDTCDTTLVILNHCGFGIDPILEWQKAGTPLGVIDYSGRVGIGTINPTSALDVQSGHLRVQYDENETSFIGKAMLGRVGFDGYAGIAHLDQSDNTDYALIQQHTGRTLLNCAPGESIYYRVGNTTTTMRMNATGLYIGGTTNTTKTLELAADDAFKTATSTWSVSSDKRLKTDVQDFKDGLNVIREIEPKTYRYNGLAGTKITEEPLVGIIAQDMQKIAPYTVKPHIAEVTAEEANRFPGPSKYVRTESDSTGSTDFHEVEVLGFNPHALFFVLVNATKELDAQNALLQEQLQAQEAELAALRNELHALNNGQSAGETAQTLHVEAGTIEQRVLLSQNDPNPFAEKTTIRYELPRQTTQAQLLIHNASGVLVSKVQLDVYASSVAVYGSDLRAGIYTYTLVADGIIQDTRKMVVSD